MDAFGIGQALKAVQRVYFNSSRRTGRTRTLVESLKTGDLVCFARPEEAARVQAMCKDRGVDIDTMVVNPKYPQAIMERGTAKERFVFDHSWIEQFYEYQLEQAHGQLVFFTQRLNGFGAAHIKTRKKAEELARWRP